MSAGREDGMGESCRYLGEVHPRAEGTGHAKALRLECGKLVGASMAGGKPAREKSRDLDHTGS